jgi:hypothetical protein
LNWELSCLKEVNCESIDLCAFGMKHVQSSGPGLGRS